MPRAWSFPVLFLWSVTKNTEMHAGLTRPLRFCSLSKPIILFFWQSLFELPREITQGRRGLQQKRHKSAYLMEMCISNVWFFFLFFFFIFNAQ